MSGIYDIDYTDLLSRAQAGDGEAFETLYRQTALYFYAVAARYVGGGGAEQVLEDAYVSMFRQLKSLKDKKRFVSWARFVVIDQALETLKVRKTGRRAGLGMAAAGGTASYDELSMDDYAAGGYEKRVNRQARLDPRENRRQFNAVADVLPLMQRTCTMLWLDGLSNESIAEELGIPLGTVKTNIRFARTAIETTVQGFEKQPGGLYGMDAFTYFVWLFQNYEADMAAAQIRGEVPAQLTEAVLSAHTSRETSVDPLDDEPVYNDYLDAPGQTYEYAGDEGDRPRRWPKVLILLLVLVLAGSIGAFVYLKTGSTTIDLETYVTEVTFSMYEGYGTVEAITTDTTGWDADTAALITAALTLTPSESLHNGEKVTVSLDTGSEAYAALEEILGSIKVEYAEFSVSGLTALTDPIEDAVSFEGYETYGTIADMPEELTGIYTFEWSQSDGLSNGDTVTLTVTPALDEDEIAQTYGYEAEDSYTFEVTGLEEVTTFAAGDYIGIEAGTLTYVDDGSEAAAVLTGYYEIEDVSLDGLYNGDVVTVTLVPLASYSEIASAYGLLPEAESFEYTLEGMEERPEELDDYAEVLNMFYDGLESGWSSYDSAFEISSDWETNGAGLEDAGYAFVDLDGDETMELIISTVDDAGEGVIRELYTYIDGEIVALLTSDEMIYYYTDDIIVIGESIYGYYYYYILATESGTMESMSSDGIWYSAVAFEVTLFSDYVR